MALLTSVELAAELKLKPKKIRLLARSGKIPAMRFGHEWRFDLEQVRAAAAYVDPITASAHRMARKVWMLGKAQPRRKP